MAMYSPTFLIPDNIAIDKNVNNTFSWQNNVSGGDSQVAFQLFILRNSDNVSVYDSTKITSSTSSHVVPLNTLVNGTIYKWQVRVWRDSTNYVDSEYILFYANATPTLTMTVNNITSQNFTFTASYSQAEGIPIRHFRFILYDNTDAIVQDSGYIYSTTPSYQMTGMVSGNTYKIECQVTNQREQFKSSGIYTFTTNYAYPDAIPELIVTPLNDIGSIQLNWTNIKQIFGTTNGAYSFVTGKFGNGIKLNNGTTLTYSELIPSDFTITGWYKFASGFKGVILKVDDYEIGYDGTKFYYKNSYRITAGRNRTLPTDFFLIGVKHCEIVIVTSTYVEILK